MITLNESNIIYELITDKINQEEFYKKYPINLNERNNYFLDELFDSINKKDTDTIEICLDIIDFLYDEEYIKIYLHPIYEKLIEKEWLPTFLLERILDSIEVSKENRKYYIRILDINKYDKYDSDNIETFMVPIWSKCLWNIYKTGSSIETVNILNKYRDSPYAYLRDTAQTLLKKFT